MKISELTEATYYADTRLPKWVPKKIQDRIEVDSDGHWNWVGGMSPPPERPVFYDPSAPEHIITSNKRSRPHRLLWDIVNGHLPRDQYLRRICPEKFCVNPQHHKLHYKLKH